MDDNRPQYSDQDPVKTGLKGLCPRCGEGKLFSGLSVKEQCSACGLDYSFSDEGDGPAVFVILLLGFLVTGLALAVELSYEPPLWMHLLLWVPLLLALGLPAIRAMKGMLICQQYRKNAHQGELDRWS